MNGVGATYHQCSYMPMIGAKWYYDWSSNPPICDGVEAVPMIYGASSAGKPVGGNSSWILWFNEPELTGQNNYLTPEQAAQLWNDNVDKYPGKKHVSPGVTDLVWLSRFLSLVSRKPDAIAIHYYAWRGLDAEIARTTEFLRQAVDLAQRYGIGEVWLTEWAALPGYMPDAAEYMRWMLKEGLPSFPIITWEAMFQLSYMGTESWALGIDNNTSLVDYYTGQITEFGQVYKDAVGSTINPDWDEASDLNKDGIVDILDLSRVAAHFRQKKT